MRLEHPDETEGDRAKILNALNVAIPGHRFAMIHIRPDGTTEMVSDLDPDDTAALFLEASLQIQKTMTRIQEGN